MRSEDCPPRSSPVWVSEERAGETEQEDSHASHCVRHE